MPFSELKILSAPEQVAAHLSEEITQGRLQGVMPGIQSLSKELGIHQTTAEEAIRLIEYSGLIVSQGVGKPRKILPLSEHTAKGKRIAFLLFEPEDVNWVFLNELRSQLSLSGHDAVIAPKTISELGSNLGRLERMVRSVVADAWLVVSGPENFLKWFAQSGIPSFALFGSFGGIKIAGIGPDKGPSLSAITQRLFELNHRAISLIVNDSHRKPNPNSRVILFLDELRALGISPNSLNLPDWTYEPGSFQEMLDSLFKYTPPTALIVDEFIHMFAIIEYLAVGGIRPGKDIALFCLDQSNAFHWADPRISHLVSDERPWIRRILRWTNNVALGKEDHRQGFTQARIFEGDTLVPAPQ